MKLYHGSTSEILKIDLQKSKPNKDFGKGFYLSDDERQAHRMALYKSMQLGLPPVVNVFEFDERFLRDTPSSLRVKRFEGYTREWAEFVFANRTNPDAATPVHDYDIVYGPIANDRVGLQIRKYMEHYIDLPTFLQQLKYMKGITFQYFFGTQRALKLLTKI